MTRRTERSALRLRIAAAAARIMAEDGVDDFALAKRKAARSLGASEREGLPSNDEVEAELQAYRELYQADEHPQRLAELRASALEVMRELAEFRPYLTGPVLTGTAGPYAEIQLQLFPESPKMVEIFLLERNIPFSTSETRRFSGDRVHPVSVFSLTWEDLPVKLSVFDPRDERVALKTSQAGRPMERATPADVENMLSNGANL